MKKSNWVLYVDGILGLVISIVVGTVCLYKAPTAEDTAGLVFAVFMSALCLIGGPWLFLVHASFFFAKVQIDQHGITKKIYRKTYFLAWEDCAECTLLWATVNTGGLYAVEFCATTIPLTQKDRKNLLSRRGTRKHRSDTIFCDCDKETYDLLMTCLPEQWRYRVWADALMIEFSDV